MAVNGVPAGHSSHAPDLTGAGTVRLWYERVPTARALTASGPLLAVWGEVPSDPQVQPRIERGSAGLVLVSLPAARGTCWSSAPAAAPG
jgi:hypothetical protein